jgi:hypothetical protein
MVSCERFDDWRDHPHGFQRLIAFGEAAFRPWHLSATIE